MAYASNPDKSDRLRDENNAKERANKYPLSLKNGYKDSDLFTAALNSEGEEKNDKTLLDFVAKSGLIRQINLFLERKEHHEDTFTEILLDTVKEYSKSAKREIFNYPLGAFVKQLLWSASKIRHKSKSLNSLYSSFELTENVGNKYGLSITEYERKSIVEKEIAIVKTNKKHEKSLDEKLKVIRSKNPFQYEVIVRMNEFKILFNRRNDLHERFEIDLKQPKRLQGSINKEMKKDPPNQLKIRRLQTELDELIASKSNNEEIREYLNLYVRTQNQWQQIGTELLLQKIVPSNVRGKDGKVKKWYQKTTRSKKTKQTKVERIEVTAKYIEERARKEYSAWRVKMKKAPE